MKKRTATPGEALPPVPDSAYPPGAEPLTVSLAPTFTATLAAGPEQMQFCGRLWQRGVPQTITAELYAAMQDRGAERHGFVLTTTEEN